jgi:hypothetical protein
VRTKPSISRRSDGRWTVRRPVVGFRPTSDETVHESWRDAVGSLTDPSNQYAAGGYFERVRQHTDAVGAIPAWTPLDY